MKVSSFLSVAVSFTFTLLVSCNNGADKNTTTIASNVDSTIVKTASTAFIYGYPMVEMYGIIYSFNVDTKSSQYKGPFNKIVNVPRVFTPADKAIVTPNSDTPYGFLTLDLRTEPYVISVPQIEKNRYYSIMFLDLYTYIYDVVGSRATGNDAGKFLVAGPNWKGEIPAGIKKVLRCETDFSFACFRTQLFNPADLKNVIKIQDQYSVEPLSSYLKTAAPPAAPVIDFPAFTPELAKGSEFYTYMNFLLQYCPVDSSETKLRADLNKLGLAGGNKFSPDAKDTLAIKEGTEQGVKLMTETIEKDVKGGVSSGTFFGSRQYLGDNYMNRAVGAKLGIGGLISQEAEYFLYKTNAQGEPYNTAVNNYAVTFKAGEFPPVNAFWSFTMYDGKTELLIENPINRYIINSPMLPQLQLAKDGSLTLYIQKDSPGKDKESNWLPAPSNDNAYIVLRCYWPKEAILNGSWKAPPMVKVN
jgi:hypothetical protein